MTGASPAFAVLLGPKIFLNLVRSRKARPDGIAVAGVGSK